MAGIDRSSPIPIYHQLKSLIRERIENGHWRPGDRLPTEYEFCERYAISRAPVRQALAQLAQDGLLRRHAGLGTFVSDAAPMLAVPEVSIQAMTRRLSSLVNFGMRSSCPERRSSVRGAAPEPRAPGG